MAEIKLSVLLCGVPSRIQRGLAKKIILKLDEQAKGKPVEIIYLLDNKKRTIGQKRNDLLGLAQGENVVFIDDDDDIVDVYIDSLLEGIKLGADVVVFDVEISIQNGAYKKVIYDAAFPYDRDYKDHYQRLPNHLMCVKREIALKVGFPEKSFGEDSDYAKRLRKHIKRQARIDKTLYYYNFSYQISEAQ